MSKPRYGFKARAKRLAAEVRQEMGLSPLAPLDPYALAELYGVRVFGLEDVGCSSEAFEHFSVARASVFSAALVPIGGALVVVENRAHAPVRRRTTMGHEMAHVLWEHRFDTMLVNENGCRIDDGREAEATELGGELLIPFEAAKGLARRSASDEAVALRYGVSVDFARWRMNATGARTIAARQLAAYQRARGA